MDLAAGCPIALEAPDDKAVAGLFVALGYLARQSGADELADALRTEFLDWAAARGFPAVEQEAGDG